MTAHEEGAEATTSFPRRAAVSSFPHRILFSSLCPLHPNSSPHRRCVLLHAERSSIVVSLFTAAMSHDTAILHSTPPIAVVAIDAATASSPSLPPPYREVPSILFRLLC